MLQFPVQPDAIDTQVRGSADDTSSVALKQEALGEIHGQKYSATSFVLSTRRTRPSLVVHATRSQHAAQT